MSKMLLYLKRCALVVSMVVLLIPVQAQTKADTIASNAIYISSDTSKTITDTLAIAYIDSTSQLQDSIVTDSTAKKSKWDFRSIGGNDTTYYSFYGHIFNIDDTLPVQYWQYNNTVHELEVLSYDSTLQDFHITHPAFRHTINNSYLGNMGSAVQSNIFAEPNPKTGFVFMESYTPYTLQSENMLYYNVVTPFTIFKVDIGPREEQNLDILHTQNVNPFLNFHVRFKNYSTQGTYIRQKTRNNTGTLGASYNQGPFSTHFNWVFNRIDVEENGGIIDDSLILETTLQPTEIGMRLNDASTFIKDRQLYFDQKIGFLKTHVADSASHGAYWFSLQYTYHKQKSSKIYTDADATYAKSNGDTISLYSNNYNNGATFDSTYFFHNNHNFRINLEENPKSYPFVGAYFGFGIENNEYYYFNKDIGFDNSRWTENGSTYFEGGLYRLKGEKFKFSGNYKVFISGYRSNNMQLDGFISNKFGPKLKAIEIRGEGLLLSKTPDYLLTQYYSNHYRWENNFVSEKITSFRFMINVPYLNTYLGSRFNLLGDYIYFNEEAKPTQYDQVFSVFDIYLKNTLNFGAFALNTRLNYQNSGNTEVLALPDFSGYAALYWHPNFHFTSTGGNLRFQLGADIYYWTSYYGQAYSPALARFHNQSEQQIGNYPFAGLFWNFEIKRLRFYIRYEHATYRNIDQRNYFGAVNYTSNPTQIRYGLVWTFYD